MHNINGVRQDQWFSTWGRDPREGRLSFFWAAKASDKNIHVCFQILYFVYGTTFHGSQNNRITWQKL